MAHKGYEIFITDPDTVDEMTCKICNSICDVKRRDYGPTSFGGAMLKHHRLHDRFDCPHREEEWHKQALELYLDIEKCHSPSLKEVMQNDLNNMIGG